MDWSLLEVRHLKGVLVLLGITLGTKYLLILAGNILEKLLGTDNNIQKYVNKRMWNVKRVALYVVIFSILWVVVNVVSNLLWGMNPVYLYIGVLVVIYIIGECFIRVSDDGDVRMGWHIISHILVLKTAMYSIVIGLIFYIM